MEFRIFAAAALLAAAAPAAAQEQMHAGHGGGQHEHTVDGRMPLLRGLGSWSLQVTTSSVEAQQYFDQGLALAYGFNHDEARRSFEEAFRLDPACAMCAWGIAYAVSPNINMPMDAAAEKQALAAMYAANALSGRVTQRERDMIAALTLRFDEPAGESRAARDSAYAAALRVLAHRYPEDADIQVLFADALMNLRPWNQWTKDGAPQPGTLKVVETLERVLAQTDRHAGACHFYVHAVEASLQPERALPCAERLPKLMPGAGHVVHMPAHVYMRVGMYEEAARANIAAMEADRALFAEHEVTPGIYPMFYAQHNIHFLWAAYTLSGQHAKALAAARTLAERIPTDNARAAAGLEALLATTYLTHARFGDWAALLAEPAPAADLNYVKANYHYARGVAHAGMGDLLAAQNELDSLRATVAAIPEDMIIILNPARTVLRVAELVLEGRIAAASGDVDEAVELLRAAVRVEDGLTYDEPPAWYEPVRQVLGTVLLDAGRAAEAEAAFREDLSQVRENGWSLAGLERALNAQGRTAEAAEVSRRLEQAWQHADVEPVVAVARTKFRSVQLPTGVKLRYAESGAGGDVVVLLHGYSDSWYSWSQVLALLPADVRALAIDLRGHGRTEYDGTDYSMDALGDDVAALLDRLGIEQATIVGHSMGSLVAQGIAVRHPERVRRLVLVGPPEGPNSTALHELGDFVLGFEAVPDGFIREFQVSTAYAPVDPRFIERAIVESEQLSVAEWRGLARALKSVNYLDGLKRVQVPALLIAGEKDAYFPRAEQESLLRLLPDARLVVYEETGHAVHWERTARFTAELLKFMRGDVERR